MVTETILSLRKHLVNRKIESLQAEMENPQEEHKGFARRRNELLPVKTFSVE